LGLSELVRVAEGAGPAAELIFGDWYPATRVDGLRAKKTAKSLLLGGAAAGGAGMSSPMMAMERMHWFWCAGSHLVGLAVLIYLIANTSTVRSS
jgi:hypothetical protein